VHAEVKDGGGQEEYTKEDDLDTETDFEDSCAEIPGGGGFAGQ